VVERPAQLRATVEAAGPSSLRLRAPGWSAHEPGQFAMLRLESGPGHSDPLLPRPMAVFRAGLDWVEFRFKVVGRGTARLARLRRGDAIDLLGPLGRGFPVALGPALLVGGGTGIASLYELAARIGKDATVLLGARTASELLAVDAFAALPVDLRLATEDGSSGARARVTDLLVAPGPGGRVYACGPEPMMRAVARFAAEANAPCFVSLESPMACGFRVCLGCAVPALDGFRYVCHDGPVFAASELGWGPA
jgi:dihydroorotate dehydrogenase electron transfer subunit